MADELGPMNPIESPAAIQNLDILDLTYRGDAYMMEIANAASSSRRETTDHDLIRSVAMEARWRERYTLYAAVPELDLPKYHPKALRLPDPPALNRVENADSQQLLNLWAALRIEITWSDSAERASGFKDADQGRIVPLLDKIVAFNAAIQANPEIDLPDVDLQEPGANPG
jgi:hypothetical protein